ncbi:GPI inositol-deacylase [Hypsizygus marmoreus]|uniref:GPI inositol-deacylase n=1 Tax=Hypsizygus marmoreus TaxID=39966 RepID=A0A369JFI2_HYPMA|nr:GPI inositol-deacylase [Hypsizygus marmoreus]
MPPSLTLILGSLSLATLWLFYLATLDTSENLSPQGCRMSWMSPSYILQNDFNTSWTPLARRYSLSLYREVGWDPNQAQGTPVLFIPGNAGSSHQVRSIASSATRQFYTSPSVVAPDFSERTVKPLDFFAVEFNEDLSAFHGPTLDSQIAYISRAITYILSLYPANTSILIMGHSMGGIVATSLLPSPDISTIITMSTPHVLPPARFDSRIDKIYRQNRQALDSDPTPILSLCGGATDMMIPSESCILPMDSQGDVFRRTVFTSALEGAWTGVGHREMVWCHQVRWRVARAALEVGAADSPSTRGDVLDTWLRDGHTLPNAASKKTNPETNAPEKIPFENVDEGSNLLVYGPRGSRTYLLHVPSGVPSSSTLKAVVLVGLGSIPPVSPQEPAPLRVSVYLCSSSPASQEAVPRCNPLEPSLLKLIPNPVPGEVFPVPDEGSGESEGSVVYEGDIPPLDDEHVEKRWIAVRVENGDGRGWVAGGFSRDDEVIAAPSTFSLLFRRANVVFRDAKALRTHFMFPNILSNALIVYRYTPTRPIEESWCSDPLLAPLIMHTSHPSETHYYPFNIPNRRILLHTHSPAPYIPVGSSVPHRSLNFVIYATSLGCNMLGFDISIDWSATLGRWASRYPTTLVSWAVGVVAVVLFTAWGVCDRDSAMPAVHQSLSTYSRYTLRKLLLASFVIAILPLPVDYYLGTRGELFFAPIAPLLLLTASGLVFVSWWVLSALIWPIGLLWSFVFGRPRRREEIGVRRSTIVSMGLIFALIFLFVPWQVAYLGCWLIHLLTCASSARNLSLLKSASTPGGAPIPLIRVTGTDDMEEDKPSEIQNHESQRGPVQNYRIDNHNHNMHLLLLMTWLLPLVAPVLAVWVRTLATAGLTTPFDGDHDFLNVAPFLVLVDFASWNTGMLFERQRFERALSVRWCLAVLAGTGFFFGPRRAYGVFDVAKIAVGLIVIIRVGRRYWGGAAWSVDENKTVR